jgi:hypothetical protein
MQLSVLAVAVCVSLAASATAAPVRTIRLPGLMVGLAPWSANNGPTLKPRLKALGLPALSAEGTAQHIHVHLDIALNGRVPYVPPGIGIDAEGRFASELHTHDPSGIIHVESPSTKPFTLGQFFDVWGLRFTPTCIGGYCATKTRRIWTWVNGKRFKGNPRTIVLRSHEEIVVAFGTLKSVPKPIPRSFPFPSGY